MDFYQAIAKIKILIKKQRPIGILNTSGQIYKNKNVIAFSNFATTNNIFFGSSTKRGTGYDHLKMVTYMYRHFLYIIYVLIDLYKKIWISPAIERFILKPIVFTARGSFHKGP